jgi:hypothetical protein
MHPWQGLDPEDSAEQKPQQQAAHWSLSCRLLCRFSDVAARADDVSSSVASVGILILTLEYVRSKPTVGGW